MKKKIAFAIGAHPDDIEFKMAGTLLRFRQAGWELHYLNIANGSCGSTTHKTAKLIRMRADEAKSAATLLGAQYHESLCNDLEIVYKLKWLRRLAAVIREVGPTVILTHPPVDYMEDHTNACRLVVTAAFTRESPNFKTIPPRPTVEGEVTLYHCTPHGLCDPLRRPLVPEFYVDTTDLQETMRSAQLKHQSQLEWLQKTQAMDSFISTMGEESLATGRLSKKFKHAEGWWRHLHYGFCGPDTDPMGEVLGKYIHRPRVRAGTFV